MVIEWEVEWIKDDEPESNGSQITGDLRAAKLVAEEMRADGYDVTIRLVTARPAKRRS